MSVAPTTPFGALWRGPLAMGALTVFGLLSALLGQDGVWLWLAWIALAVPIATVVLFLIRPRA
ncbi:MAG: hypothetical protein J0H67_05955 [Rhodospirillales bacterium]|nr:hypothetical protein [Rhodospirillales bacterium]